jgi:RNA polymerase sigma-70 factor (sigma-E family)
LTGLHLFRSRDDRDREFADYYTARGASMRNSAYLMCGDWHLAEDLTQIAFTKLYRVWDRVSRHEVLDQYLRRVLLRSLLDEKRRPWRRESSVGSDHPGLDRVVVFPDVDGRLTVRDALAALPARQRAVLVLRFWEDLPVHEVAEILGVPEGTVKSLTARGLQALRAHEGVR